MGNSTSTVPLGSLLDTKLNRLFRSIDISTISPGIQIIPRASVYDSTGTLFSSTSQHTYTIYHNAAQIGVAVVAGLILLVCALLTGLTLAICGLDDTLIRMRTAITGTAKDR
jgi:hypothetical protein